MVFRSTLGCQTAGVSALTADGKFRILGHVQASTVSAAFQIVVAIRGQNQIKSSAAFYNKSAAICIVTHVNIQPVKGDGFAHGRLVVAGHDGDGVGDRRVCCAATQGIIAAVGQLGVFVRRCAVHKAVVPNVQISADGAHVNGAVKGCKGCAAAVVCSGDTACVQGIGVIAAQGGIGRAALCRVVGGQVEIELAVGVGGHVLDAVFFSRDICRVVACVAARGQGINGRIGFGIAAVTHGEGDKGDVYGTIGWRVGDGGSINAAAGNGDGVTCAGAAKSDANSLTMCTFSRHSAASNGDGSTCAGGDIAAITGTNSRTIFTSSRHSAAGNDDITTTDIFFKSHYITIATNSRTVTTAHSRQTAHRAAAIAADGQSRSIRYIQSSTVIAAFQIVVAIRGQHEVDDCAGHAVVWLFEDKGTGILIAVHVNIQPVKGDGFVAILPVCFPVVAGHDGDGVICGSTIAC